MKLYNRQYLNELRQRLGDYLELTGRDTRHNFICVNPEHEDHSPSMHYYKKLDKCLCFGCGVKYDLFEFIGIDFGIAGFKERIEKASEIFHAHSEEAEKVLQSVRDRQEQSGKSSSPFDDPTEKNTEPHHENMAGGTRDYKKFFASCQERIMGTGYWRKRGLSPEIVRTAGLGYHPDYHIDREGTTWRALIIPVDDQHFMARNTDESAGKNNRFRSSGGGRVLYTRFSDIDRSTRPTFIVEGELDAISVADAGGEVIALGSVRNIVKLIDYLMEHRPKRPLILALDQDEAGRRAENELAAALWKMEISFLAIPENSMHGCYDANEFLQHDRDEFIHFVHEQEETARSIYELEVQFGKRPPDSSR